ncbi:MAG: hypothetical protein RLZZ253_285, partial [Verrucomicrobiota bacterium]
HSLALNFILPPPGTVGRWTIRMRHTEIAEPVVWEPDGWVTVFQQDTTISTPGWIPFQFQVPFEYNGVSNLMVDFSFKSAEPQSRGAVVECSTDSTRRRPSITRTMSSGDPLEWSGNTPGAGRVFEAPNLRLGVEVAVTPAVTSNFVSGVWNGEVVFPQGYRAIQLRAVSDTGIISESQPVVFQWVTPSAVTVDSSPVGGRVSEGRALTLRASAQGTRPFTYRWTRDGEPIRGATSPGYTVPQVSYAHRGEYRVEVTNPAGVATSSPFTVTVDPILEILEQPVSQTVNPGSPVTFAVRAEGMGTLRYQWYKNGEPLPDQIRPSLVLPAVAEGDQADYWVVVSNEFDRKTSDWAGLEVNDPVSLSTHPVGAVLMPGQSHELRVEASGTGPLEYQWSRNGARIDGATGSVLVFNSVTESVEGDYTVSVRNVVGVVVSESARIRVVDQIGFTSQGVRQPKFPGELLFPVTVRRFGGGESGGAVRIVPISSTLPESAFRTLPVPAELRWAPGDSVDKTYLVAVKAGVQIRTGGEQLRFGLEGFQDAAPGENLLQVVTLVQADPGVLNFGAEKLEIQSSGTADRFVEVPVVRNQGSVGSAGVEVAVAGGTAPAGSYFLETQGPVLWQDREVAPKLVRVRFAAGQAVPARGWTIDLRLQNPTGGALIGPVNTVRIRVNPPDARGVLAFGAPVYRFQRPQAVDQEVSIPVYRSAGSVGRVAVMLETASAMAVEGPDYLIPPESRMFLWEDGEVEPKYFKLVLHETARVPANGLKIQVRLSGPAGGAVLGAPSSALLTFLNADDQPPQLSVVTPASGATVSGESVLFKGTAMDMAGVERVEVALNGEMPVAASLVPLPDGTGVTWMATLIPEPGQNQVRVTAMGGDGMVSEPVVRRFRFVRQRPDLAGTYDGLLEPAANLQEFSAASPDYRPFELSRGTGILSTTVSASGALSGRVCIAGAEVPFTGTVQRDGTVLFAGGTSELRVLRPGQRESLGGLGLWVDENGERPVLRGEFKAVETRALYSRITAEKCVFSDAKALPPGMRRVPSEVLDPSSDNGRYTLAWLREPTLGPGQSNDLRGLAGSLEGTGALRVSPNGNVTLVGRLRYSTVSCGSRLSPSGRVPFHQGMLRQNGFVTGRLPLGLPETNADAVADFSLWVLPPWGVGAREEARPALLASRYVAPSRPRAGRPEPANPHTVFGVAFPAAQPEGGRGLPSLAVDMDLDSAVLGGRFEGVLQLGLDGNAVLVPANTPNVSDVRFRFETADGTFGAGFRIPGVRSSLPLQGVVFQKQGIGLGLGETGGSFTVELTPRLSQPMGGVRVP